MVLPQIYYKPLNFYLIRWMVQEIVENCDQCQIKKEGRRMQNKEQKMKDKIIDNEGNAQSWFWLIEKVKKGPISDMICLIPKIRHFDLFGDLYEANRVTEFQDDYLILLKMILKYDGPLDLPEFLAEAIRVENVEMVKFVAPKIKKHKLPAKWYIKLAEQSGNEEILEYLNSLINNSGDLDSDVSSDSDDSFDSDDWINEENSKELESSSE